MSTKDAIIKDIKEVLSRLKPYTEIRYGEALIKDRCTVVFGGKQYYANNTYEMIKLICKANGNFAKEELEDWLNSTDSS